MAAEQFQAGLARHGIAAPIKSPQEGRAGDLAIFWGYRFEHLQCGDHLVMELGYIGDRMASMSCGLNGLNGRAQFPPPSGGGRASRWFDLLDPQHTGDYILIMGQCPGDASIAGLDVVAWAKGCAAVARARWPGVEIYFRPHPLRAVQTGLPELGGTLDEDLARAHLVITYNSNAGVDAVMAGSAVVACDRGSMVYSIASQSMQRRQIRERMAWLQRMSYCQWSRSEIINGDAWEVLNAYWQFTAPADAAA